MVAPTTKRRKEEEGEQAQATSGREDLEGGIDGMRVV
jgi:hypothetical protein